MSLTLCLFWSVYHADSQSLTIGLIAGASVVFLLLLLVPLFICVVRHRRSSAASSSATLAANDATRPLLHPSDGTLFIMTHVFCVISQ